MNNKTKSDKSKCRKGTKKTFQPKDRMGDQIYPEKVEPSPNDLAWYANDPQILSDAASIPYSIPIGMSFTRMGKTVPTRLTVPSYDDAVPGIMVSRVMPLLGNADNAGDAVNVAANSVYQNVRSRISGSRPYDAVDMMIYLGAMDSLFCYVTWLTRLYGTVFTYHNANRYLSRALIEAQGVDYDDLVNNLSIFRAKINILIAKIGALYLPSILPLFKRHSWLFSNYYIEGESEKDQIYFHAPAGYHYFTYDNDNAGMLQAVRLPYGTPLTVSDLINDLNQMIDPIYADEDFNRISGDFLKAYEGKVFTLTEIPDIATVSLIHNEEVLLQFKNGKYKYVLSNTSGTESNLWLNDFFNYHQDTTKTYLQMVKDKAALDCFLETGSNDNAVAYVPVSVTTMPQHVLEGMYYDWSKDVLLTTPHHNVVPGENMINSRLTLAFAISDSTTLSGHASIDAYFFGSEWPVDYRLFTYHRNRSNGNTTLFSRKYDFHLAVGIDTAHPWEEPAWLLQSQLPIRSAFRYLPEMAITYYDVTNQVCVDPGRTYFEIDNYALINAEVISGLHNAAILGEYNIPKLSVGA